MSEENRTPHPDGPGARGSRDLSPRSEADDIRELEAAADMDNLHPADAADHIEGLDLEDQIKFVKQLPIEDAAESIAEMDKHVQQDLLLRLNVGFASKILSHMAPDDATDILENLDEDKRRAFMRGLDAEDRAELSTLLAHDPDTAGGVMNTNIVILSKELSVDQAIQRMRMEAEDKEIPYYAYLIDANHRLVGVVSMRDILISKPGRVLKELIKDQKLIDVYFNVDKAEVARLISHYNLLALPVVDYAHRLLGVVTVDDVIDIIQEEASEDMQAMVGAGADETTDSPWSYSVKKRIPWLVINLINSSISAWVVHMFEGTIAQMAVLAVLMPIVANQSGNTGQQALAVMIRQMATEKFDRKKSWLAVLRELKVGLANTGVICVVVYLAVLIFTGQGLLSAVMAAALAADMVVGAFFGASIPLLLKELGRDPAQASSIFLTTITDSFGFFAFLGLAGLVLM